MAPPVFSPLQTDVARRIDPLEPGLGIVPSGSILPYDKLGGIGFERLCFELLVAEGKSPQLFGKPGQRDYGADIIVGNAPEVSVYQCKNYTSPPSWSLIRDELLRFEAEWLGNPELPKPVSYIFGCSQPLDDIEKQVSWLGFKAKFQSRTSVRVEMRGRNFFDAQLRSKPDIIAGLFSGAWAEVFCGAIGWQTDPWVRICRGQARHSSVIRFLERHDSSLIYVAETRERVFCSAVADSRVVLVRGVPGTGKTMTSLELVTRLPGPPRPIYYATLLDGLDIVRLWQSAVRRSSVPSVFVLDDCHLDFPHAEAFVERLQPELTRSDNRTAVVLLARSPAPETEEADMDSELVTDLNDNGAVVKFTTTESHFRQVLEYLQPKFIGLSENRFRRLFHVTGGDLALLDEALDTLKTPPQIDELNQSLISRSVYRRYFGGQRLLPTLTELAALAQFDLAPPMRLFDGRWASGEKEAARSLVAELFAPPRYQFVHSSLAELAFHALVVVQVDPQEFDKSLLQRTSDALWRYLLSLLPEASNEVEGEMASVDVVLQQVLRTKLKLLSPELQASLKLSLLVDERMLRFVDAAASVSIHTVCLAVSVLAKADLPEALLMYLSVLHRKLRSVLAVMPHRRGLRDVVAGLRTLKLRSPRYLRDLQQEYGPECFLALIVASGTVLELFKILQHTTPEFSGQLLDHLKEEDVKVIIDGTIASGRSVGTLNLAMRGLQDSDKSLLIRLQVRIGAERFLDLIKANGTIFDLFMILKESSPQFASQLLDHLKEEDVKVMIDRTIASGRSIGTLDLAMRGLQDSDRSLLIRLQVHIGAERFLNLIKANGTIFDLFMILKESSPQFASQLLDHLKEEDVKVMIDRTIASGRSIGTLHLTMRDLQDSDKSLLIRLEECIGAERFLNLIKANGTIFELFMILKESSPQFASQLLDHLKEEDVKVMIDRTIASGRSIGTLDLAMRGLQDSDRSLLIRLQVHIGAERFLDLIKANGTILELFKILRHTTPEFSGQLLDHLKEEDVKVMIDKAIAGEYSMESTHFSLGVLARVSGLRERLESAIGVVGWWKLLIKNGTLNSVRELTNHFSSTFRTAFRIAADLNLNEDDWARILRAGQFRNACMFVSTELSEYPMETKQRFRRAVGETAPGLAQQGKWFDLQTSSLPDISLGPEAIALNHAFHQRVNSAKVGDLLGLDFLDGVNAVTLLWRERQDIQKDLAQDLWNILGAPADWPIKKGAWAAIRLILVIAARSPLVSGDSAHRLFDSSCAALNEPKALDEMGTLPLFLLLWNLAALSYDRGLKKSMSDVFTVQGTDKCMSVLAERTRTKATNGEKALLLALAGFLHFFYKHLRDKLRSALSPLTTSLPWLEEEIVGLTFIPEFFVRQGISLLQPRCDVFSFESCAALLEKADSYADRGPAVEALVRHVQRYAEQDNVRGLGPRALVEKDQDTSPDNELT